jgi:hypothetical protein
MQALCRGPARVGRARKIFFFEKKKQKTFVLLDTSVGMGGPKGTKM